MGRPSGNVLNWCISVDYYNACRDTLKVVYASVDCMHKVAPGPRRAESSNVFSNDQRKHFKFSVLVFCSFLVFKHCRALCVSSLEACDKNAHRDHS